MADGTHGVVVTFPVKGYPGIRDTALMEGARYLVTFAFRPGCAFLVEPLEYSA